MWRGGVCLILFQQPRFDLDDAFRVLSAEVDLSVRRELTCVGADALVVQHRGGPPLTITFVAGPRVQRQAVGLGTGTRHVEVLGQCNAFFWISVDDVRAALKDGIALAAVQRSLLQATEGFQYATWDDKLYSAAELAG